MMVGSRFLVVIEVQDCVLHALSTLKQWHSFFLRSVTSRDGSMARSGVAKQARENAK